MQADVVIVGAGVIGLSTAWQLARRSQLRIVVLEKGAALGEGSTGASSAICRHRYSRDEMITLARDGIHAYRNWADFVGLAVPKAEFHNDGVLWMPGNDREWAALEQQRLSAQDIRSELLDDRQLQERFPAISPCVLLPDTEEGTEHECRGGGSQLFETDAGYMDPVAVADDLLTACRGRGVEVRFGVRVSDINTHAGRVTGVQLADGACIEAAVVVNAAGPWCNDFLRESLLAKRWTLVPTRIQVMYLDLPSELQGGIPVSLDMHSGVYFRQQNRGQQLVVGSAREVDEREVVTSPDNFDLQPDENFRLDRLHALHHRIPGLPYRGKVRGYCGLYTVNRQDMHPLVGESDIAGFYLANGFSGHGFKLAPAVGGMLARSICGEKADYDSEVAASFLAPGRDPIPLAEHSVLA
jgi:sarcosine oxidase subunit beta